MLTAVLGLPALSFAEPLRVVASIFPVADMARQVGGGDVTVTTLVPAGASPHTFELKPSLVKEFAAARVFLMIGAGLEFWADQLIASSGQKLKPVVLSEGMAMIRTADKDHDEEDHGASHVKGGKEPHHGHETGNPHIWLDPHLAGIMVDRIQAAFTAADPAHAAAYESRARAYRNRLDELDHTIADTVKQFRTREIVCFHPSWDYFAARYGLVTAGVIEKTPGRDPGPREIAALVSRIRSFHIPTVFAEPQFSPKAADVIAKEAGVKVLILDPLGGDALPGRGSYIDLMMYNVNIMKEAME